MFLGDCAAGGIQVREYEAAISPEAHVKHTVCGRTAPPADLLESCHLLAKKNSGVTRQWREFNHRRKKGPLWWSLWIVATSSVRAWTTPVDTNQTETLQHLTPPATGSALSQQTHNPPIALLQYTYRHASPPSLLSQNTQKTRWEPEPT